MADEGGLEEGTEELGKDGEHVDPDHAGVPHETGSSRPGRSADHDPPRLEIDRLQQRRGRRHQPPDAPLVDDDEHVVGARLPDLLHDARNLPGLGFDPTADQLVPVELALRAASAAPRLGEDPHPLQRLGRIPIVDALEAKPDLARTPRAPCQHHGPPRQPLAIAAREPERLRPQQILAGIAGDANADLAAQAVRADDLAEHDPRVDVRGRDPIRVGRGRG